MKFVLATMLTLTSFTALALEFKCRSAIHPMEVGDTLETVVVIQIPDEPDVLVEKVVKENSLVKMIFRHGKDYYSLHTVAVESGEDLAFTMTALSSPSLMLYTLLSSPKVKAWANCWKLETT